MIEKNENKEYLPIEGLDSFRKATVDLLLGSDNPANTEVCTTLRFLMLCVLVSRRTRYASY
jgi:aspartate/tyrosine/aromatic aminotransferase